MKSAFVLLSLATLPFFASASTDTVTFDTSSDTSLFTESRYNDATGTPLSYTADDGFDGGGILVGDSVEAIIYNTTYTLAVGTTYTVSASNVLAGANGSDGYAGVGFRTGTGWRDGLSPNNAISCMGLSNDEFFMLSSANSDDTSQFELSNGKFSDYEWACTSLSLTYRGSGVFDYSFDVYKYTGTTRDATATLHHSGSMTNTDMNGDLQAYFITYTGNTNVYMDNFTVSVTSVPEPSTFAAIGGLASLAGAFFMRRRK